MKKIFLSLSAFLLFTLSANAYTYQWNVPYDNHGKVYANNVQGSYYMGGRAPKDQTVTPYYNNRNNNTIKIRNYNYDNYDRARNKHRHRNKD